MSLSVLRRISSLRPVPITTAEAPAFGRDHVDIGSDDRWSRPEQPSTSVPPSYTPGICYHDAHVVYNGRRVGLLFLIDDLATVLPCLHNNEGGV